MLLSTGVKLLNSHNFLPQSTPIRAFADESVGQNSYGQSSGSLEQQRLSYYCSSESSLKQILMKTSAWLIA